MNKFAEIALAAVLAALPAATLSAQTTYTQRHSVNNRSSDQQSRINQGVASGQITNKGAANLQSHQNAINSKIQADRAVDSGHLTAQDRHQLARAQNRQSQRVYRDKHNAATQPGVTPK